ncbi:MAG: TolC family protein [Bacteroidetes bacterium]|nr:TolC family protein [Bacteroidota bacterium]
MKKLLTLYLLSFFIGSLQAQDSTFSLQQAIDYALANHSAVKNALIEEEIANKKINELIGAGTPQINGSAELNNFLDIPVSFVPGEFFDGEAGTFFPVQFGQQYSASAGVSISQLLFDGSYMVGLQASKTYRELSRKQSKQTRTETAVNVSKAYYGALVAEARMEIIDANLERVVKLLSDTRAYYENGFVEKIDVDRIELTYNNLMVEKEKILRYKSISYTLLKFQMSFPAGQEIKLSDKLEEIALKNTSIPENVNLANRPEYEVMTVTKQLQELDVKRYKSLYLPGLVAFGSFSYNNARNQFDIFDSGLRWFPTSLIGLKLSIPIWDGLQKSSKISQSKLTLQKVENAMDLMKNSYALELESAKINFQNYTSSLVIVKKNKELANEIARVAKIKYDNGVGSSLEVVDAESSLREADANFFNTLYDTIIARIDLDKASGQINY